MPITPLDPFWFSNRGLPTVFDQEIDYFTILSQLRGTINDTVELINELETEVNSLSSELDRIKARLSAIEAKLVTLEAELKAYIDEQVDGVEERLDEKLTAYKAQIDAEIARLIAEITRFKLDTEAQLSEFETRLDQSDAYNAQRFQELTNYINSSNEALKALLQIEIDDLQSQIDQLPETMPTVYNPASGNRESLQTALNDYWRLLRSPESLSAAEVDALEISAIDIDNLNESAINIDLMTRSILTNN
jgi:chromosome segregation ATPase